MSITQKQSVVRKLMLALAVCAVVPAQAGEPIRLQVIPYQVNKQATPVLPVLLPPPPFVDEQAKPRKRRSKKSRDWETDDDFDWLMD